MKNFFVLIIIFNYFYVPAFSQNLISNGNFEKGTRRSNVCYTADNTDAFNGIDNWQIALHTLDCSFHMPAFRLCPTPDWVDLTVCNLNSFFAANSFPPPGTPTSNKFIGLAYQSDYIEAIRQTLSNKLIGGSTIKIKMKMASSNSSTPALASIAHKVGVKIVFSKWGEHWNSNPATTDNVKWEPDASNFVIPANSAHVWFEKEVTLFVPEQVDGGAASELENITIAANCDDEDLYFFIDDVEVYNTDPCDNICTPEDAFKDIEFRIASSSDPDWKTFDGHSVYTYEDGYGVGGPGHLDAFLFNVKNATSIKLTYEDRNGAIRDVPRVAKNVNVLKLDGYDYYQYWYFATDFENHALTVANTYSIRIYMNNCKVTTANNHVLVLLTVNASGLPAGEADEDFITELGSCCDEPVTYNNFTFPTKFFKETVDYIRAGTTGTTIVNSNSKVRLYAQNELTLGSFFSVKPGADFKANVVPCGFGSMSKTGRISRVPIDDTTNRVNSIGLFKVYPNPNNGKSLFLEVPGKDNELEICIFDINGRKVFEDKMKNQDKLHIDPYLPSGIFTVQVKTEANTYISKLCIIK